MEKKPNYPLLLKQIQALLGAETDEVANLATVAAVLFDTLPDVNWAGFYKVAGDELLLGPFQGKPACIRLPYGKGVCWAAVLRKQTVRVDDVHAFNGHIACDSASASEIVVPIYVHGRVWGVLDIDSPVKNRFTPDEETLLEEVATLLTNTTRFNGGSPEKNKI